jgi:hypothetical protein
MHAGSSRSNRSLTGVWEGIYSYPLSGLPTVPFTATLIEAGSSLSGSVHEPCTMGGSPNETLFFSVNGIRQGTAVSFVKTYHGTNPYYGTIVYAGTVNDDATEIEGRWTIPGDWSGRFLMTRSGDQPRAIAESEGAKSRLETVGLTPQGRVEPTVDFRI